jgi:hypothetical protein
MRERLTSAPLSDARLEEIRAIATHDPAYGVRRELLAQLDYLRAELDTARCVMKDCIEENHKIADLATADHRRAERAEATLAAIRAWANSQTATPGLLFDAALCAAVRGAKNQVLALIDTPCEVARTGDAEPPFPPNREIREGDRPRPKQ